MVFHKYSTHVPAVALTSHSSAHRSTLHSHEVRDLPSNFLDILNNATIITLKNDNGCRGDRQLKSNKVDAILHPVRMRIIHRLAAGVSGRRMTAQEIGSELPDVPQATLYRHLTRLVEADVVQVVDEHAVRGTMERVFGLSQGEVQLGQSEIEGFSREAHMRYFTMFLAGLLGDFARYLERSTIDLAADGVGYRQFGIYLTDEEFAEFNDRLNSEFHKALSNGPSPGRKLRLLTRIIMPANDLCEAAESERKDSK